MSEFLNDIKWEWEMNHSFSSEKWEELFRRLEEAEKAQAERKTTALTEVCIPCGYIFIDGNDYDTLGAKKAVCCPDCGNENFVTVATIIKQLESANHDYEELMKERVNYVADNARLREALEIVKQYISGVKGVCNIGNAMDTLDEIEQALKGE